MSIKQINDCASRFDSFAIFRLLAMLYLHAGCSGQALTEASTSSSNNITVSYNSGNRTFVFDVANYLSQTSYLTGRMQQIPTEYDQYISFGSDNVGINIIAFSPTKEPRYFEINFSKTCLFPVFAIGLSEAPRIGIWENSASFQIDNADFIGLPGFNRMNAAFKPKVYSSFTDLNSAEKDEVYSQAIDLSDYQNLISTYITVFCPFFTDPLQSKFMLDLMLKRRNNAETTKLRNSNNELANLFRVFFVPYAGQHTIVIPELKQNTKFVFNITTASSVNVYVNYTVNGNSQRIQYFPEYLIFPPCKDMQISIVNPLSIGVFVQMNTTYTNETAIAAVTNATGLIIGLSIGGFILLIIIILLVIFRKRIFFCFHQEEYDQFEQILPSIVKSNVTNYPEHINSTMVMMAQMANENNLVPVMTDKNLARLNFEPKTIVESNFLSPMTNIVVSSRILGDTEQGVLVESLRTNVTYDIYPKLENDANDDKHINHKLFSESSINILGSNQHLIESHVGRRHSDEINEDDHNIPIMRLKLPRSIDEPGIESVKKVIIVDKIIIETAPQLEESNTDINIAEPETSTEQNKDEKVAIAEATKTEGKAVTLNPEKEPENSIAFIEEQAGCMPGPCK